MNRLITLLAGAAFLAKAENDACDAVKTKSCTSAFDNSSYDWSVQVEASYQYEINMVKQEVLQEIKLDGEHDLWGKVTLNNSQVEFSVDGGYKDGIYHLKMDATLSIGNSSHDLQTAKQSISEDQHGNFEGKSHSFTSDGYKKLNFQVVSNLDFSSIEAFKVNDTTPTGMYWDHDHTDAFIRFQVYDSGVGVWSTQYVSLAAIVEDEYGWKTWNYKIYNEVWKGGDCAATYTALSNERPDKEDWCPECWNQYEDDQYEDDQYEDDWYEDEYYDILLHEHEDSELNGAMPAVIASAAAATLALTAFCAFKAKRQGINDDYFGRV